MVQPTRPTGVEGQQGGGASSRWWWNFNTHLPKLPKKPRWKVRVQSECFREQLGEAACMHGLVPHMGYSCGLLSLIVHDALSCLLRLT